MSLNYSEGVGKIIPMMDVSLEGGERVQIQLVQGKRHPSRYESRIRSNIEKKYICYQTKILRCFKILEKVRY